jgi:hypothetical protein
MNLRTSRTVASLLLAAALTGVGAGATAADRTTNSSAQGQMAGVFTGRYANGMPIYRLPPVTVVAGRKAELAKIEREEALARGAVVGTGPRQPLVAKR